MLRGPLGAMCGASKTAGQTRSVALAVVRIEKAIGARNTTPTRELTRASSTQLMEKYKIYFALSESAVWLFK